MSPRPVEQPRRGIELDASRLDPGALWHLAPDALLDLYAKEQVTVSAGVPTIWMALLQYCRQAGKKLDKLKHTLIGGAAVPRSMIEEFRDAHDVEVRQGWGMVVGLVNGIWAGTLSLALGGFLVFCAGIFMRMQENQIQDFAHFLKHSALIRGPLLNAMLDVKFIVVTLGLAAVVGVITEIVQWLVARVRNRKDHGPDTTIT